MRRVLLVLFVLCLSVSGMCFADTKFTIEAKPLSVLISPSLDGFTSTSSSYWWSTSETIDGTNSFFPSLLLGAEIGPKDGNAFGVSFGGGYLYNEVIESPVLEAVVSYRFRKSDSFSIAPHFGLISFTSPEWYGTADLALSETTGVLAGVNFAVGSPKVSFSASLDYINAAFDVTPSSYWRVSSNEMDISGLAIQLGVLFKF